MMDYTSWLAHPFAGHSIKYPQLHQSGNKPHRRELYHNAKLSWPTRWSIEEDGPRRREVEPEFKDGPQIRFFTLKDNCKLHCGMHAWPGHGLGTKGKESEGSIEIKVMRCWNYLDGHASRWFWIKLFNCILIRSFESLSCPSLAGAHYII